MIKRPLALIGFSFTAALLISNSFQGGAVVVCLAAVGLLFFCLLFRSIEGRNTYFITAVSLLAAGLLFFSYSEFFQKASFENVGKNQTFDARICSDRKYSTYGSYYIASLTDGSKIRIVSDELDCNPGDRLSLTGDITGFSETANDYQYFKSKGIFLTCSDISVNSVVHGHHNNIAAKLSDLRALINDRITSYLPNENGALIASMVTGNKSLLNNDTKKAFSSTGLSHLLAVSGLHMSVVVLSIFGLLRSLSRKWRWLQALLCIVISFLYCAVADFSLSSIRSFIMISVMLSGYALYQSADALNSLGLAALLINFFNPFAVMDISFMLSFSASLGLIIFGEKGLSFSKSISSKLKFGVIVKFVNALINISWVSLIATLFCLPVIIFVFGQTSVLFISSNILTFFAVPPVLLFGLLTFLLGTIGAISALIAGVFSKYLLFIVDKLSDLPFNVIRLDSFEIKLWCAVIIAFFGFVALFVYDKNRAIKTGTVFAILSLAVVCSVGAIENIGNTSFGVFNKYDSAVFTISHKGQTVVILDGKMINVSPAISALNEIGAERIDYLILQNSDDEFSEFQNIADRFSIGTVISGEYSLASSFSDTTIVSNDYSFDLTDLELDFKHDHGYSTVGVNGKSFRALFVFSEYTPVELFNSSSSYDFVFTTTQLPEDVDLGNTTAVCVNGSYSGDTSAAPFYTTFDNSSFYLSCNDYDRWSISLV